MYHPSRGGVRGGRDQFKWDDVKVDKHRENYLGHSVMAPVGRWQKGKDLNWYARDKKSAKLDAELAKEEIKRIKEEEEQAMREALGLAPKRAIPKVIGWISTSMQISSRGGLLLRIWVQDMRRQHKFKVLAYTSKGNRKSNFLVHRLSCCSSVTSLYSNSGRCSSLFVYAIIWVPHDCDRAEFHSLPNKMKQVMPDREEKTLPIAEEVSKDDEDSKKKNRAKEERGDENKKKHDKREKNRSHDSDNKRKHHRVERRHHDSENKQKHRRRHDSDSG